MSNPPINLRGGANALAALARVKADVATATATPGPGFFSTRSIGVELDVFRRELMLCGRDLRASLPSRGGFFVDEALQLLERLTCKIAVIGQVKAGKSSFINAFVRRPGLLPTDVNPWTTAVTQLHFGRDDAPRNTAASFTFFDANEWRRLAQGGGHLRDLTQRLVPGFEAELLQTHVDAMRRRAEGRLGGALGDLLGQHHSYSSLTPEILERYVCAGVTGLPGAAPEQKGFYSDIVKTADLFFDANDFTFPTTILDTPGTNDPFLVRDEITRGALESADIYIVVLTARQALSSADVALLRILRGLHKDRIAVFINRIDDLGDVVREAPQIIQHVKAGLRAEFPGTEIPIVAGSAHWARLAIAGAEGEIKKHLNAKTIAYAAHLSAQAGINPMLATLSGDGPKEQLTQALLLSSGLPALSDVLAALALRSHAGQVLKQIKASFSELVHVYSNAARHELEGLATETKLEVVNQQQGEDELRLIAAEIEDNDRLIVSLHSLLIDLQARTDQVIDDHCEKMGELLNDVVQGFSEMECENLRQAIAVGRRTRVWRCHSSSLRRRLEECLVSSYAAAELDIRNLETYIFPRLKAMLSEVHPQWAQQDDHLADSLRPEPPSLNALGMVVALDLDEPWWKRWFMGKRSVDEQIEQLDLLITREFYAITAALVTSVRGQLKVQQTAALDRATKVYVGLVEIFQEQSTAQLSRMRALISARDAFQRGELRQRRDDRGGDLRQQLSMADEVRLRLDTLDRMWGEKVE